MQRAMLFIDFENFDIAKYNYYKKKSLEEAKEDARSNGRPEPTTAPVNNPRLDFNELPKRIVALLPEPHVLVKSFLFAPKPDQFLMDDTRRAGTYNWINGLKTRNTLLWLKEHILQGRLLDLHIKLWILRTPAVTMWRKKERI